MKVYPGIVKCEICGQNHRNPPMWYVFPEYQEGIMIVCPVLSTPYKMRYFPLRSEEIV